MDKKLGLVVGATGAVGLKVVQELLAQGGGGLRVGPPDE